MSAELSIGTFISKFWGAIALAASFVVSHIRLNQKVEWQRERLDTLESGWGKSLDEIKTELKELNRKVEKQNDSMYDLHIKVLERPNKSE